MLLLFFSLKHLITCVLVVYIIREHLSKVTARDRTGIYGYTKDTENGEPQRGYELGRNPLKTPASRPEYSPTAALANPIVAESDSLLEKRRLRFASRSGKTTRRRITEGEYKILRGRKPLEERLCNDSWGSYCECGGFPRGLIRLLENPADVTLPFAALRG
jgi:hypothetical protein